jgi:hypothetical protein
MEPISPGSHVATTLSDPAREALPAILHTVPRVPPPLPPAWLCARRLSRNRAPRCLVGTIAVGKCTRREWCPFAHEEPPEPSAAASSASIPQPFADSRRQITCHFFAKGQCKNGDACPFAHTQVDTMEGTDEGKADGLGLNVVTLSRRLIQIRWS